MERIKRHKRSWSNFKKMKHSFEIKNAISSYNWDFPSFSCQDSFKIILKRKWIQITLLWIQLLMKTGGSLPLGLPDLGWGQESLSQKHRFSTVQNVAMVAWNMEILWEQAPSYKANSGLQGDWCSHFPPKSYNPKRTRWRRRWKRSKKRKERGERWRGGEVGGIERKGRRRKQREGEREGGGEEEKLEVKRKRKRRKQRGGGVSALF